MLTTFQIVGGTVCGSEHQRLGRNNQDAYAWASGDDILVAVVCDGCGSGAHSEFGARLGARLFADTLARTAATKPSLAPERLLGAARAQALTRLAGVLQDLGGAPVQTVREHLLFTVVGMFMTRRETVLFALGDGVLALDEEVFTPTFPGNAPPYLGYALIPDALDDPLLATAPIKILTRRPTCDVERIVLGSDGVADLSRQEGLSPLLQEPKLFQNPYLLGRRLAMLQRKKKAVLPDDTTMILIRRRSIRRDSEIQAAGDPS